MARGMLCLKRGEEHMIKLFAVVMVVNSVSALAQPPCERVLTIAQVREFLRRPTTVLHPQIALPSANIDRPVTEAGANEVILESDLGTTLWKKKELHDWLKLAVILKSDDRIQAEISRITENPGYCTPGLSELLCEHMRKSREAYIQAISETPPVPPEHAMLNELNISKNFRTAMMRQGGFRFAWGAQMIFPKGEVYPSLHLTDDQARRMFEILARETLLRHLATETSLGTRLALASFPATMDLLPLFAWFTTEFDDRSYIGDEFHTRVPILEHKMDREGNDFLIVYFHGFQPNALTAQLTIEDADVLDEHHRRIIEPELVNIFQATMSEFLKIAAINKPAGIKLIWEDAYWNVDIAGLDLREQLLFYYYFADKIE